MRLPRHFFLITVAVAFVLACAFSKTIIHLVASVSSASQCTTTNCE